LHLVADEAEGGKPEKRGPSTKGNRERAGGKGVGGITRALAPELLGVLWR